MEAWSMKKILSWLAVLLFGLSLQLETLAAQTNAVDAEGHQW
jgi:preprotein translocase subunit SecG